MNSKIKRILCFALVLLSVLGVALPALAVTTTITNQDNPTDFFEYQNSTGWHDLNTPYHYDASGNVAYCIEHEKDPPSSGGTTYNDFDPSEIFGGSTITGIQAILDHGYPASSGGPSSAKAHYATANAIRAWIRESAGQGYNFMVVSSGHIRAKSGYEDVWNFFLELLGYARAGATTGGSSSGGEIRVSSDNLTWQVVGGQLQTAMTVEAPNGYTIQPSNSAVRISGYTGGTYDSLTITAPMSLMGTDVTLFIQGNGGGSNVTLYWYEPSSSGSKQRVVVSQISSGTPDSGYVTITGEFYDLAVKKVDSYTGTALDGAVFQLTSNGAAVGLTQTGAGAYTAGGNTTQFTTGNGTAVITGLPGGSYQLVEVSAPSAAYTASAAGGINLTQNASVTVQNAPTEININKTDMTTGAAMANITFTLLDSAGVAVKLSKAADGTYRPNSNGSTAIVTDAAGKAKIMYLPTLTEQEYRGYSIADPKDVVVTDANTSKNPAMVTIENKPLALSLVKQDGASGVPLEGVTFKLFTKDGKAVSLALLSDGTYRPADTVKYLPKAADVKADPDGKLPLSVVKTTDTLITDAQGKAVVEFISQGKYRLEEQQQAGYVVLEGLEFEITSAHTREHPLQYTVSNVPTRLLIEKQCGVTKELLTGATFQLLDKDGKTVKLVQQKDGTYQPAKTNETGVDTLARNTISGTSSRNDVDASPSTTFPVNDKGQVVICYLPAGTYTVKEVTGPTGYALSAPISTEVGTENVLDTSLGAKQNGNKITATPASLLVDSKGNYLAETSIAVVDLPLALKISKVHSKTQKPLMGAAFQLKAADKLTTPLTFTVKDGVYWYDAKGSVTTIEMDKNAEALVYGLPVGKYVLEETVVPTNFFPAVPQNIEIAMMNTSEAPKEVVVVNTPTVKLGIDSDKFNVVIAIALTVIIGGGLSVYAIIRRKRK